MLPALHLRPAASSTRYTVWTRCMKWWIRYIRTVWGHGMARRVSATERGESGSAKSFLLCGGAMEVQLHVHMHADIVGSVCSFVKPRALPCFVSM
jgi:hypothetical protein